MPKLILLGVTLLGTDAFQANVLPLVIVSRLGEEQKETVP